ncbi:hypothetical protein Rhopal_007140-T1 [Rhodotorula paludigena]|uniref:Major facilitator superfamily (MFS) profile domain-containing protein n=1 Tax=Rhodotorula paludigena TaxID=86838 RepID=A0AAV5GX55_9BASI|nr:hypothetical protein Rhopal_007140-T1 [Rhodotorula paludigena]
MSARTSHDDKSDLELAGNVEREEQHSAYLPTASSAVPVPQTVGGIVNPPSYTVATQAGVLKVENVNRVWGRNSKIALFVGIGLAAYIYSLDGTTTWQYQFYATSDFALHSLLGAIGTAQAIVLAVTKPFAAKFADVFGRAEAFCLAVFFYCLGYICIAACKDIHTYAAGAIIYYIGYAALQILIQIVIADCTNLRWRGLISSLTSIWFFVNAFVSSNIAQGVLTTSNWHWGYAMFIILIPVTIAPIAGTLFWAQHRAKKLGLDSTDLVEANGGTAAKAKDTRSLGKRVLSYAIDIDALGLILFAAGWACILLPLTLVKNNTVIGGDALWWDNYKIIILLVVGGCSLIAFCLYERLLAIKPLFPFRFFKNYTIMAAALIGFFDFVSFYLQYTFQYTFISVTKDWSIADQGYFAYTQTLALTFAAICAGFFQLYFRRTKWLLVGGLVVRLAGVGMMIHSRGAHGTTAELVWSQLLQGLGGGVASASCQLLAQASVAHQDVATVTALVLLFAEIGNAVGTAIATAIWRDWMPRELSNRLASLGNDTLAGLIYGAPAVVIPEIRFTNVPAYTAAVAAYSEVMKILLICATCIAIIPIGLSLFVNNIFLSDAHNAVEGEDLAGRALNNGEAREEKV